MKSNRMRMPESSLKSKSKDLDLAIDELDDTDALDADINSDEDGSEEVEISELADYEDKDLIEELKNRGYEIEMDGQDAEAESDQPDDMDQE